VVISITNCYIRFTLLYLTDIDSVSDRDTDKRRQR